MRLVTIGLALSLACGSAALAQAPSSAARCDAEGIPEVAIAACTRMIESGQLRGEKLADALKIRGDVHYNKGDPEGALEDYDRATRINPRYADAYYNRGNIFDERQEHAKAIAEYTKAIEITPAYEYLTNRARSYQLLKDFGRAIPDYTQAVQIRPEEFRLVLPPRQCLCRDGRAGRRGWRFPQGGRNRAGGHPPHSVPGPALSCAGTEGAS